VKELIDEDAMTLHHRFTVKSRYRFWVAYFNTHVLYILLLSIMSQASTDVCPLSQQERDHLVEIINSCYELKETEKGQKITGHTCLQKDEEEIAKAANASLCFGEVLPQGAFKLFDKDHLDLANATTVFDLGSGLGKLTLLAFLMYPNLKQVVGVELSPSRCEKSFDAMSKASWYCAIHHNKNGDVTYELNTDPKRGIELMEIRSNGVRNTRQSSKMNKSTRSYFSCCGDLFKMKEAWTADVVICETKFPEEIFPQLCEFMDKLAVGTRLVTFEDLEEIHQKLYGNTSNFHFMRFPINASIYDKFFTSWAPVFGHRFHLWKKVS
jgi:hypothetical protein